MNWISTLLITSVLLFGSQSKAEIIFLNTPKQLKEFFAQGKPAIIMQGADWCSACVRIFPSYAKMSNQFGDKVLFGFIDVDRMRLKMAKKLVYVPTFVAGKTEKEVKSAVSLNDFKKGDYKGLLEYITRYTGVKPEVKQ
jgi:thiol-disulfide isomerase/thioredoxin